MFMMNVAGLRYSMAAGYLPASPVYASHCNKTSYNTRSGGGGNCTRRPGLSSGSDRCLCGTTGVRSVFGHPDTSRPCLSCARRSDDTEAVSAKYQACPHLAVHAHPDGTLEIVAT